jgi:hypothetical protein
VDQRRLASVLFAVVGVYLAVSRIPDLTVYLTVLISQTPSADYASDVAGQVALWAQAAGTALVVLLGAALVWRRHRVADRLFPAGDTGRLRPHALQAVALSVLGCYFAVDGVSRLFQTQFIQWSAAAECVLGIALFLGATGLARLWVALRSGGK